MGDAIAGLVMRFNSLQMMRVVLLSFCIFLAACKPSKEDAARACSKNTRQTVEACSCWIDLVEQRLSDEWFAVFLLEQTDPERALRKTEGWSNGAAFNYADRVMTAMTNARRSCRFNPFGL